MAWKIEGGGITVTISGQDTEKVREAVKMISELLMSHRCGYNVKLSGNNQEAKHE